LAGAALEEKTSDRDKSWDCNPAGVKLSAEEGWKWFLEWNIGPSSGDYSEAKRCDGGGCTCAAKSF